MTSEAGSYKASVFIVFAGTRTLGGRSYHVKESDQPEVTMLERPHVGASVGGPQKSPTFQASRVKHQTCEWTLWAYRPPR